MNADGAQVSRFTYNGRQIEVFVARSPGVIRGGQPQAYSLEFVGNSMRAEQAASRSAQMWGSRSVEVWVMNYPGFGQSDGPASLGLIPSSALAVYDRLKVVAGDRPIVLKGFSLGTTAALCVASHRSCAGIILQSPPPLQREIMWRYGWWNLWMVASVTALEVPGDLNSLSNAPKVKIPAVFIISGNDTIVPREYQMMVADSYAGPKRLWIREGMEHNALVWPNDPMLQSNLDWLWSRIGRGTGLSPNID